MICPKCGAGGRTVRVLETRNKTGRGVYRRRECGKCLYRFTSYELDEKRIARLEMAERKLAGMMKYIDDCLGGANHE